MGDLPESEEEERVARAKLAQEQARETISEQVATISDLDDKAVKIFRINLVIFGLLATAISIAANADSFSYAIIDNIYTKVGVASLFLSTLFALLTYTSTSTEIGVNDNAIREILDDSYEYDIIEETIAIRYGEMIRTNYKKNASNVLLFTYTLYTEVVAIVYLAIAFIDIYDSSPVPTYVNALVIIFLLIFGKLSGLYGTTDRWWEETKPASRFKNWVAGWVEWGLNMFRSTRGEES